MLNPRRFPTLAPLLFPALLGCPAGGESDTAADLAEQATDDLADLRDLAAELGAAAEAVEDGARATATESFELAGDCIVTANLDGNPLTGTFELSLDTAPCGVSFERGGRSLEYGVDAFSVDGSWSGSFAGDYAIAATGSAQSSLSITTVRGGTTDYDSSFSLDGLTAEYASEAVQELTVDLTYTGFGGGTWTLAVATTDGDWAGTLTGPQGRTCVASGALEDIEFACD